MFENLFRVKSQPTQTQKSETFNMFEGLFAEKPKTIQPKWTFKTEPETNLGLPPLGGVRTTTPIQTEEDTTKIATSILREATGIPTGVRLATKVSGKKEFIPETKLEKFLLGEEPLKIPQGAFQTGLEVAAAIPILPIGKISKVVKPLIKPVSKAIAKIAPAAQKAIKEAISAEKGIIPQEGIISPSKRIVAPSLPISGLEINLSPSFTKTLSPEGASKSILYVRPSQLYNLADNDLSIYINYSKVKRISQANEKAFANDLGKATGLQPDVRIKKESSFYGKIKRYEIEDKKPATISDNLGGRIIVRETEIPNQIKNIENNFKETKTKDFFKNPTDWGYRGINIKVKLPNGLPAEVQIHTPWSLEIANKIHPYYEKWRNLDLDKLSTNEIVRMKNDISISREIANNIYKQATKGIKEVRIPVRPSSRLGFGQVAPGEVSFRPGQPIRPTQKLPISPTRTAKILEKDSLPIKYNKLGEESNIIKEADKTLIAGEINKAKSGLFNSFKNSMENIWTNIREFIQDDWYRVKKLVENKNWKTEGLDPYQKEILFRGRVGARLEEVNNAIIGIDRQIVNFSKSLGIKDTNLTDEINSYLIVKHAPERNLRLGENAAGISTKEAQETLRILEESPRAKTIKNIGEQISNLNKKTLEVLKEGQVIGQDTYDLLNKTYKNHIPLNRIFDESEDVVQVLMNKGLDVRWSGLRRAVGSEKKVADIMTNVAMNLEAAIVRAEKNLVDLSTLKFARENNYLGGIFSEIKPRAIGKTFDDKIILKKITDPNVLALRENGKAVYLKINDPHLAIALKGINRYKVDGIMRGIGTITRWFASLATRFNPEFAIPNKIRDIQEAVVYAASKREMGIKGAVRLTTRDLKSQKDVIDYLRGIDSEGTRLYKQMKMDGGTTGGLGLSTRKELEIDIAQIRKINRSKPRQAVQMIIQKVEEWNTIFEDSTRLSIYKEALTKGASRERAAVLAKEGTVNFNKMGRGGPVINSLYMFSNASIQGSAKMLMAMKNPKVAGVVVGSVGVAVATVGEWNDRVDLDWRDKVSKWDRMNGLPVVIPSDGENFNYITIPISWGIKPIKISMDYFYDLIDGKAKSIEDAASGIFASFIEAYNPIGGTDFTSAITPTVLDLPVDLARNKKWSGSKLRPDFSAYTPDSLNYFDSLKESSTGKFFIETTDKISEVSGGRIEISPADVNYSYEQIIGGAGRTASKVINTFSAIKTGELLPREIPFVSRFYRSIPLEETGKAGQQTEEIRKILTEQSRERIEDKQDAEAYYEELKKMPRDQARELFGQLIKENSKMAEKINDIIEEEKLGLTYIERLIKQLGVENGERAKYIFNQINQLKTQNAKRDYYQNLIDKKIITKQVNGQILELFHRK